jgi:aspartate/methionine/tyrosine aminotransferase
MSDSSRSTSAPLSQRGQELVSRPPSAEYLREHFAHSAQGFDASARPDGYIALCIAENRLVWDLLQPKVTAGRDVPARALGYDAMIGAWPFREQLARFLARRVLGRAVEPRHLAVLAGAGSVLEILFHALADPGDGVLIPTPSYAGFWPDLETRDGLTIVPVHCDSAEGFRLTTGQLDRALAGAGRPVRALLFTSPNNPLGTVYTREELEEILAWAERARIHVVFDEVYALSVFGERAFVSSATLRPRLGERVHIVWAFSKDFAASGLRCGVLVSENEAVIAAVDALAYWACCSGDTQFVLGEMISDDAWVDRYAAEMQSRLGSAYIATTSALAEEGIPFLPAEAGFFFLCDLRAFLAAPSWEAERALWRRLLEEAGVNLTPGSACRVNEPGFMRLCFAGVAPETAVLAVRRIGKALRG